MDKLRIAQVAPLWTRIPPRTYGGIELIIKLIADELVAGGHRVTLFAPGDSSTAAELRPVIDTNLIDWFANGNGGCFEYYAASTVAEVLRAEKEFDVIHYHLGAAWLPLAAIARTPGLFTLHTAPHFDDEWVLRRWPEVAVAAVSHCQIEALGRRLGREFPVVYNGCDFESYEPSFEPGKYLVFLGRMSHGKNPLAAIRVAQAVGLPIILAGKPQSAEEEEYFAKEVAPLIDEEGVRWIGVVDHAQKNELLRHAAALVFPVQWDEPFGLVMIEAMACGTPVVACRRGAVAEVVDQGITGFHAGGIDGLAELIPRALALDRHTVRAHARRRFGFQQMVEEYVALYRTLLRK